MTARPDFSQSSESSMAIGAIGLTSASGAWGVGCKTNSGFDAAAGSFGLGKTVAFSTGRTLGVEVIAASGTGGVGSITISAVGAATGDFVVGKIIAAAGTGGVGG